MHKGLKENKPARVIYLDMNAFFASIEQQKDPSCQHKPVAVVSQLHSYGTVLASSYEAKSFGISTGTKVFEAQNKCPNIIFKQTQLTLYNHIHKKFINLLREKYGPEILIRSIDEVAIILPANWQNSEMAKNIALEIKNLFKQELGECIRCSIGIAPNIFLSKLATNLEKPNGLVEINDENIERTLASLRLTDLPGIAHKSALKLAYHGINSPFNLYKQDADKLRKWFGIWGQQWWWRLHGYEVDDKNLTTSPLKSISHQHVLQKRSCNMSEIIEYIEVMTNRLIYRLQNNELKCCCVGVFLSRNNNTNLNCEYKFNTPSSNSLEILNKVITISKQSLKKNTNSSPIQRIIIYFTNLIPEYGFQIDLFNSNQKKENLSQAVQLIREKYGFEAIGPACSLKINKCFPKEQIGFGKIKDKSKKLTCLSKNSQTDKMILMKSTTKI